MILYFADKKFKILGTASTSLSGGYVISDDTKKEEVETGVATLDCTVAYTDDTRADIESWCRAGNYVLAYYGKDDSADVDIVNLFMITTTELSVLDHTIKFESEDSGLDLLNNLAKEYTGTEQMSAADYINKVLEKTGFRLRNNNVSAIPKKLEWTSTDTVTKRLADIAEKFDIEITYGFSVKGLTVSDRWVDIADETGKDTKINLYINKEVNNITVKNTIENLATALYATGKDNLTLVGFTIPEEDKTKYQIDPDGNLVSLEALTKWARVDYSSKDSFSGNLYQKFESSDTASQADLYRLAKEKLDSISDIETNYEVDIADLPPGVGIGDRVNIVDDAGNTYISGRILELETSVTDGTKKATLGEYVIKDSGISELVENLASSFANLSKVRELYTWIAYADTIDGDGFSFSPEGKEYLGTAANQLTEEAGTDPAVYKWVKIKGEQGEQGIPGETGPTGAPGEKGDPGEDGYSPTVDLSTGESGSTVLTVTNKTGPSSTELKDQAARNDANDARNYADNYINYDETGTMIASEAVKPMEATKNNVLITEKDVQIRDGQKVLASYGETSTIGTATGKNMRIAGTGLEVRDGEKVLASYGASETVLGDLSGDNILIEANRMAIRAGAAEKMVIEATKTTQSITEKRFFDGARVDDELGPGGISMNRWTLNNPVEIRKVSIKTDSGKEVGSGTYSWSIYGSATLQIVISGDSQEAMAVDWSEYTTLEVTYENGIIVSNAKCDKFEAKDNAGKFVSFTETSAGTGTATATTGSVSIQPNWWRCGNLVQVEFGVATTGAVNPGKNLATGTITGIPRPITTKGIRAVSYYGNNANVLFISQQGGFTVRNCGSDALAKGNDAIGIFTYITDGIFTGGSSTGGQQGGA